MFVALFTHRPANHQMWVHIDDGCKKELAMAAFSGQVYHISLPWLYQSGSRSVALCYNGAYFLPECSDSVFVYLTSQGCLLQLSFQLSHCSQLISEPCLKLDGKGFEKLYGMLRASNAPIEPFLVLFGIWCCSQQRTKGVKQGEHLSARDIYSPSELVIPRCADQLHPLPAVSPSAVDPVKRPHSKQTWSLAEPGHQQLCSDRSAHPLDILGWDNDSLHAWPWSPLQCNHHCYSSQLGYGPHRHFW